MNTYKKDSLLDLLDKPTILALMKIFDLRLKHIAARLGGCTIQNVKYHIDNGSLKEWHKMAILQLFEDHGLDPTALIIIHTMTAKRRSDHESN